MATYTVANGGGDINSAATFQGGVGIPGASDDIDFTATSGQLTVNVATTIIDINFANYKNVITFTAPLTVTRNVVFGDAGGNATYTTAGAEGIVKTGTGTLTSWGKIWTAKLTMGGSSNYTITFADKLTISGELVFSNAQTTSLSPSNILDTERLDCKGGFTVSGGGILVPTATNGFTITFNGTGAQTWAGGSSTAQIRTDIIINKPSGTLTFTGNITYNTGLFTYTAGTTDTGTSVLVVGNATTTFNTNGNASSGVTTNSSTGINWYNLTLGTTLSLTSNFTVVNLLTANGGTITRTASQNLYLGGSLTMTSTLASTSASVIMNGTGTWSGTGLLTAPLRFTTLGIITVSGNVYFSTRTLTHTSGTINVTGSTLNIPSATTLDTGGMTWNNVSISTGNVTSTITLTSALNTSGQLFLSSGTLTFSGAGSLNPSGSLFVQFSNSGAGAVFTLNLKNNITVTNCTFQTSTVQTNNGINVVGNSINVTGNLSLLGYGYVYGTTTLNLTGTGSWTHQSNTTILRNNLNINPSGTLTISGSIYYDTGTITHLGGTVSASSSTLWISGATIGFNTSTMTWGTIVGFYGSSNPTCTITLSSQLNCTNFYVNYSTGSDSGSTVTFSGVFALSVSNTIYIGTSRRNTGGGSNNLSVLNLTAPSQANNLYIIMGSAVGAANTVTFNNSTLTVNNTITYISYADYNSTIGGTTEIIMKGTTLTLSTNGTFPQFVTTFATNLTFEPTSTLTITRSNYNDTFFRYSSRTLKYVSGTISTTLGLVASGATLNLGAFANWNNNDIYLANSITLQSDLNPNNLFTFSGAVALSGAFNINVKGNLSIGVATSGASTPIFLNGTGTQTYSHSAPVYLSNNLTINKASGTLVLGANIYYLTGTFNYITASSVDTSTNSTTLNIGGSCTLATNGISWVNLTTSVTATMTLTNDLFWSNNWTSTAGTISFSGVGSLAPASTANLLFTGTPTINLKNNIQVTNVSLNGCTANTNQINISGNLSVLGSSAGTTTYNINGTSSQSWSSPALVYLQNPLIINKASGVLTLGSILGMIANLTYIAGEVDAVTNSNTFNVRGGIMNVAGMTFNNFTFATTGADVITLASDLYAGGTFTVGGNGTINGSFNIYSSTLNINNSTSGATITTVTYNGGSFYCSGNCTFSGGGGGGQVITTNTIYVGGNMTFNATGNNQGPTDLIMTGNGTISQTATTNPIYSNIYINTGGKIIFANTMYFTTTRNIVINLQRGNVDATKCTLSLPLTTGTYTLTNNHKINWKTVILPSTGNISMNEFFNGSPKVQTSVLTSSTTNANITFTDNFEKIAKYVNINGLTFARKNQLLLLTDNAKKIRNSGIRYNNTTPNGVPKNDASVNQGMGYGTNFLTSDPCFVKRQ